MPITQQQLLQILPSAGPKAGVFVSALNAAMNRYSILTRLQVSAFIAQIGHESGQLRYVRELGSDDYLKRYDTGQLALRLGNTPEDDGDGQFYRGRGLIQVTGRANYVACGEALRLDLLNHPELLEQPEHAAMSAAWFWDRARLNGLADKGDFLLITKRINGGTNGLADREALYQRALKVLS
ncbi:glycoside hydrolase family 19 protein [Pseudomonas cichorii]|uniref:glycoside hydrolase family 19 protein n=1 Tax=Pseudomonas cichorii TaxID=36746 RepID=UPI001C87005E|nr:glycoside hydrolase family 19 protein [Pseudomonas cichorii]MBX8488059.1 glycoside hydrolase family 19 protein [Pseudomonas cichorii]MBX8522185.1 glycoside hydrolase family 19 protein [Pseudomonas cichorii]MBX8542121.1 glycoside hydrolase family 19 protein [Pseudomonas cichorii]MBX8561915.1 glycoside hydrolase family 19 protein [Pseudomonas cichorii]MBX8566774.1 glycoside hydrolase family 19 protein [Pseudomonas cichorii]